MLSCTAVLAMEITDVPTPIDSKAQSLESVFVARIENINAFPISVVLGSHAVVRVDVDSVMLASRSLAVLSISNNPKLESHLVDRIILVNICTSDRIQEERDQRTTGTLHLQGKVVWQP